MRNPFDILTSTFIDRPKACLSIGLIGILTVSSMAMFIEFDNSEDAFFPDNETVRLLDEVEGEYQASLDFVRIIARMPDGGLDSSDNWVHLAELESILLEDQNLSEYAYPLFGSAPNNGPASIALSWERHSDPIMTGGWSDPIEIALEQLDSSDSPNETQDALDSLIFAMQKIPGPAVIDSVMLREWEPSDPKIWFDRLVAGQNSTEIIGRIMLSISTIALGDENFNNTRDASMAKLGALAGMQEVDYASALRSTLPVADHGDLSSSDGPVLISFVVTTESDSHDGAALSEIQSKVNTWTDSIEIKISQTGDKTSSVFSYSQLLLGQNENLGRN